jgi:hypothetical protein
VTSYVAADALPLLFLPIRGGPEAPVLDWLTRLSPGTIETGMNQRRLRDWKAAHPGFRSFTVLRHPLSRAHAVYCRHILPGGAADFPRIRQKLIRQFGARLPDGLPDPAYDRAAHRAGFAVFLRFVGANLAGQTSMRVDPAWGTQAQALKGFADLTPPDHVLREDELPDFLPRMAARLGCADPPEWRGAETEEPFRLEQIHDADLEALAAEVYRRDYESFGFGAWRG